MSRVIRNRVPKDYFLTKGSGESDITVHAGSYHLALREAGIEMANILNYSSIMPAIAREVPRPAHEEIVHGEVMEIISAVVNVGYGETGTAGIIFGWLHDPKTGERHGGLVCEYNGSLAPDAARPHMKEMLNELHSNGYQHLVLKDTTVIMESITPIKMYGTALVAICFLNHEITEVAHD